MEEWLYIIYDMEIGQKAYVAVKKQSGLPKVSYSKLLFLKPCITDFRVKFKRKSKFTAKLNIK